MIEFLMGASILCIITIGYLLSLIFDNRKRIDKLEEKIKRITKEK